MRGGLVLTSVCGTVTWFFGWIVLNCIHTYKVGSAALTESVPHAAVACCFLFTITGEATWRHATRNAILFGIKFFLDKSSVFCDSLSFLSWRAIQFIMPFSSFKFHLSLESKTLLRRLPLTITPLQTIYSIIFLHLAYASGGSFFALPHTQSYSERKFLVVIRINKAG